MTLRPSRSELSDTRFPSQSLFRSCRASGSRRPLAKRSPGRPAANWRCVTPIRPRRRPAARIPAPQLREPIDMNVLRPLCAALLLFAIAPALAVEAPATMLVIHGGAGLQREGTSEADEAALRAAITLALRTGHAERSEEHTSELQS